MNTSFKKGQNLFQEICKFLLCQCRSICMGTKSKVVACTSHISSFTTPTRTWQQYLRLGRFFSSGCGLIADDTTCNSRASKNFSSVSLFLGARQPFKKFFPDTQTLSSLPHRHGICQDYQDRHRLCNIIS